MGFTKFAGTEFEKYVIPIIPVGAKLTEFSTLTPDRLGKIPGNRYGDEGWGGFPKTHPWQDHWKYPAYSYEKLFKTYESWYEKDGFEPVVGMLSRLLIGIDIDTEDGSYGDIIQRVAGRVLGLAPIRTRPNSGKRLLCYRLDQENSPPIPKIRKVWRTAFADQFAVEVLGEGQQWLYEGPHPSGVHYEWVKGLAPHKVGWNKLTLITLDQVFQFYKEVEEELAKLDCVIVKGSMVQTGGAHAEAFKIDPEHPGICPDLELLKEVLELLPSDHPEFEDYDDWVKILVALKTALAGDETQYDIFEDWALPGHPDNTPELIRAKWESFSDSSLGWDYIGSIAGQHGFTAHLDFEPLLPLDDEDQPSGPSDHPQVRGPLRGPIPKLLPADFDVRKLPRRQFVLGHRFIAGAVTVGVGAPGAGKSNLAIVSALAIATGRPLTGEPVYRPGRVWIHNNEEDLEELQRRIGGMLQCHGINVANVRDNIFVTSGLDERLIVAIKLKDIVRRTEAVADVIAAINENGIIHIVIDPFVSIHRGVSENSNEEIEQVADALRHIAHETGCSIDLVHHSLKSHSGNTEVHAGDMNAARGASSLIAAARIVYTLAPMSKKTAQEMQLHHSEAARLVRLDHGKGNYTARDTNARWFELEPFNIRNGGDGTDDLFAVDGDTIAVPKPWEPSNLATEQTTQAEDREAQRAARLQQVRDLVVQVMSSDRCRVTTVLPAIEKQFVLKESAARALVMDAIPEGEEVCVEVGGRTYSLVIERQGRSPPHPIFILRRLVTMQAEAA